MNGRDARDSCHHGNAEKEAGGYGEVNPVVIKEGFFVGCQNQFHDILKDENCDDAVVNPVKESPGLFGNVVAMVKDERCDGDYGDEKHEMIYVPCDSLKRCKGQRAPLHDWFPERTLARGTSRGL